MGGRGRRLRLHKLARHSKNDSDAVVVTFDFAFRSPHKFERFLDTCPGIQG